MRRRRQGLRTLIAASKQKGTILKHGYFVSVHIYPRVVSKMGMTNLVCVLHFNISVALSILALSLSPSLLHGIPRFFAVAGTTL